MKKSVFLLLDDLSMMASKMASIVASRLLMPSTKVSSVASFRLLQSSVHPDNLYPHAKYSDRFSAPPPPPTSDGGIFSGLIPVKELTMTYSRSSGPGGQSVNKVSTKVDMRYEISQTRSCALQRRSRSHACRFHLDSATWLSDEVKSKVHERIGKQLTKDGFLVVKSDRTRSQTMNQADALRKLREAIWAACEPEKPDTDEETQEKIRKGRIKAARERVREKRKNQISRRVKESEVW